MVKLFAIAATAATVALGSADSAQACCGACMAMPMGSTMNGMDGMQGMAGMEMAQGATTVRRSFSYEPTISTGMMGMSDGMRAPSYRSSRMGGRSSGFRDAGAKIRGEFGR